MDVFKAMQMAKEALKQAGLVGWSFEFDRAKQRAGRCYYRKKVITLSMPLTQLWAEDKVRETIWHEIAHALVGPGHGHGPVWQEMAVRVGARPEAKYQANEEGRGRVQGAWVGTCAQGHPVQMHKEPQRVRSCNACSPGFDARYLIAWRNRNTGEGVKNAKYWREMEGIKRRYGC